MCPYCTKENKCEMTVVSVKCGGTDQEMKFCSFVGDPGYDTLLWDLLKDHLGHRVEIAVYGDPSDPVSVTLEDMDTNEIILDAGIYTLCGREDV